MGNVERQTIYNKRGLQVTRALDPTVSHGAKHSPPGHNIQKSEGPQATGENPSEIHFSKVKSYPNEEFSIPIMTIFNVDSNCVHPRF